MHIQINPITKVRYDGLYHNANDRSILVYTSLVVEQAGLPVATTQQQPMRVDDTTPIAVHKPPGTLLSTTQTRTVPLMVPDIASGIIPAPMVPHPTETVQEPFLVPVTISEYDMLTWMCFDTRNPSPMAIETIVAEGIRRRLGMSQVLYVFVRTAAWEAAHP